MRTIDRIRKVIKDKGLTFKKVLSDLDIPRSTFDSAYQRGTEFEDETIIKICEYFPEECEYIKGDEFKYLKSSGSPYRQLKTIDEDPNGKDIPFVDGEFFATISPAMQDVITLKKDTFVRIPMFSRGEFAIQVTGNSMKGYINNGDWIIIRKLERLDKIIYGEVYVVVTKYDNHRTIKFIKEDQEDDSILWLVPYNVEQFEPQTIEKEDVLEIYLVIGSFKKIGN